MLSAEQLGTVLELVLAYGEACAAHTTAAARYATAVHATGNGEAIVRERFAAFNASTKAEEAVAEALQDVVSALAPFTKDPHHVDG